MRFSDLSTPEMRGLSTSGEVDDELERQQSAHRWCPKVQN